MIIDLLHEIERFSESLKNTTPDYISIYAYFLQYVEKKHSKDTLTLKEFFNEELTRLDIIKSCVWYIEQSNASSVTAIEKYLNSMTKLYNAYMIPNGYINPNLKAIVPFSQLKNEVKLKLNLKKLEEKESFPAITKQDFDNILDYLDNKERPSFVRKQIVIIFKLFMLLGFKFERVKYLQVEHFLFQEKLLIIETDDEKRISIDLPAKLSIEIYEYLKDSQSPKKGYMFLNTKGHVISPAFISHYLKEIRKKYATDEGSNRFTATGLSKFAINNMISKGLNSYVIKLITGMDDIVVDYCFNDVFSLNDSNNLDQLINEKLRGIDTFQAFHTV